MYQSLYAHFGPQGWWPAESPFEVIVGAILTQNTAWRNVERAILNLKTAGLLEAEALYRVPEDSLAEWIRPAGTYRVKARRLKAVVSWLWEEHRGNVREALSGELEVVRERLLSLPGVGPETADAILLYAGGRLTFVVDAYTRRILRRHRLIRGDEDYDRIRLKMMTALPGEVMLYQEYHALCVAVAKRYCKTKARCQRCPLADWPHEATL